MGKIGRKIKAGVLGVLSGGATAVAGGASTERAPAVELGETSAPGLGTQPAYAATGGVPPTAPKGPATSTAAAPANTYNMNVPGASEGLYGVLGPALAQGGYAEQYANLPAYQAAQASTATNQLLGNYGSQVAQPTAFENFATGTAPPTGSLYGVIAQNQSQVSGPNQLANFAQSGPNIGEGQSAYNRSVGQVSGPNDVLNHGTYGVANMGRGDAALGSTSGMVTDPTRIGQYMSTPELYGGATREGTSYNTAASTQGMVDSNTLEQYARGMPMDYAQASSRTAASKELDAAGRAMASGVDATTASGRYWDQLQQDPTALPDANLDAYYDRQREKAQAGIDRAMAARGLCGSSASYDASREMLLDLGAQQVKDESDYSLASALARNDISSGAARGADEAGLARYASRNDAAQGADAAALGLSRLGLDARSANDANTLARYTARNNVSNNVDQLGQDLYFGRGDLMNRSDLTDATRFQAFNQAANAVDQTGVDAYNARTNALDAGGRLDVSRFAANNAAAQGLDELGISAYNAQAGALGDAGQLDVNRFLANTGATSDADRTSLDRYVAQSNTLNNAANTGIDRYRALTEGATAADAASRSLYDTGAGVARAADQSMTDRYGQLIESAGQADLSRTGRAQIAGEQQYNYSSLLDSILGSSYGDTIQSDEELMSLMAQLGLGASGANLQGALGNQGAVGTQGAQIQQIGGQVDQTNQQIGLRLLGG
jgi:hypothetical protein